MVSFAVVDVETTGVLNHDRVVEIAVVKLDEEGRIVGEWDTLVNPERDVGPTHIHGITPSMVSMAPRFSEILDWFGELVSGSVLVAHNLLFDQRMISNELDREKHIWLPGQGIDTLALTGQKLVGACWSWGIGLDSPHCALDDARATAALFQAIYTPALLNNVDEAFVAPGAKAKRRTHRRIAVKSPLTESVLVQAARTLNFSNYEPSVLGYLDLLDRALEDLVLTSEETDGLAGLAEVAGLDRRGRDLLHQQYFADLRAAAELDGIITFEEFEYLLAVAELLGLDPSAEMPELNEPAGEELRLGARICFTGAAVDTEGEPLERSWLTELARRNGFTVDKGVTKKNTDFLVAADVNSSSSKTRKARKWDIPVVSIDEFLEACTTLPLSR